MEPVRSATNQWATLRNRQAHSVVKNLAKLTAAALIGAAMGATPLIIVALSLYDQFCVHHPDPPPVQRVSRGW